MNYLNLPKIDLHCHLDGSVRPQSVIDIAQQQNITLPSTELTEIQSLMVAPEPCLNLDEYLTRFELPLSVMQTAEGIERIAFEVLKMQRMKMLSILKCALHRYCTCKMD